MTDWFSISTRLNDGTQIGGRAAYYDVPLPPRLLRLRAARSSYLGLIALSLAPEHAEGLLREAIELMVDAFLLDRRRNADLFGRAHAIGALVEHHFGCRWAGTTDGEAIGNQCGIFALHSRIGLSPGGRNWGRCGICGADDFQCDHVPGRVYDGQMCRRQIYLWDGDEISFTPRPRDPRCFRVWALLPRAAAPKDGRCRHCCGCVGRAGAAADDLDPSRWPEDADALIGATVATSEEAVAMSRMLMVLGRVAPDASTGVRS